jgi:hypothetical protein
MTCCLGYSSERTFMGFERNYALLVFDLKSHADERRRVQFVWQRTVCCRFESFGLGQPPFDSIETCSCK